MVLRPDTLVVVDTLDKIVCERSILVRELESYLLTVDRVESVTIITNDIVTSPIGESP